MPDRTDTHTYGVLDAERLRALFRDAADAALRSIDMPAADPTPGGSALVAEWIAVFLPLLVTTDLVSPIEQRLGSLRSAAPDTARRPPLPVLPVYAALFALTGERRHLERVVSCMDHHDASVRSVASRALALLVDALAFEDLALQAVVESCLREGFTGAEEATALLLAAPGDPADKCRWAAAQLVRHSLHSPSVRLVLAAATEARPVPNPLLGPLAAVAFDLVTGLASTAAPAPFPGPEGSSTDWAQADIVRLGDTLWPALFGGRMKRHPLLRAFILLDERIASSGPPG